jgi:hypothetical protein
MKRPSALAAVAAVSLALLAGCGKEEKSGSPCRDAYIEKIDKALTSLEEATPETDFNTALGDALQGKPEDCEDLAPGLVEAIFPQVLDEQQDRLTRLEGKFGRPTESPDPDETEDPSAEESASPSAEESASPSEEESAGPSEDESPSPSGSGSGSEESPSPEPSD